MEIGKGKLGLNILRTRIANTSRVATLNALVNRQQGRETYQRRQSGGSVVRAGGKAIINGIVWPLRKTRYRPMRGKTSPPLLGWQSASDQGATELPRSSRARHDTPIINRD